MIILGMHFGHDAGISLIRDGSFIRHWEKERHTGYRHAIGLEKKDIDSALECFDLRLTEIDGVAVTCTQLIPLMLFDGVDIEFREDKFFPDLQPNSIVKMSDFWTLMQADGFQFNYLAPSFSGSPHKQLLVREDRFPSYGDRTKAYGAYSDLKALREIVPLSNRAHALSLELAISGSRVDGAYISHHLSHAYYAHASTSAVKTLVVTVDGGADPSFLGGGIYFGIDSDVFPVIPHGFWYGRFYETIAYLLGLGQSAAGKLMGLAAYGVPRYSDEKLTDSLMHTVGLFRSARSITAGDLATYWFSMIPGDKAELAQELRSCGDTPPRLAADIAASAQAMFARSLVRLVENAVSLARNMNFHFDRVALSGGCALNCPTNSELFLKLDVPLFIPPAINDEGLSAGAALCLSSLKGASLQEKNCRPLQIAFKGVSYTPSRSLLERYPQIEVISESRSAEFLAQRLFDGAIVTVFEGSAEIGPRALGHRSILASPLIAGNWKRLNRIKSRELWRPFAPIVLEDELELYFEGCPRDSYYMLFNARVKSAKLPAITHKDGSARVQVAHPDLGFVHELLLAFKEKSGVGVLVNTSFNGKNQPIVETPDTALKTFLKLGVDYMWMDGIIVSRRTVM